MKPSYLQKSLIINYVGHHYLDRGHNFRGYLGFPDTMRQRKRQRVRVLGNLEKKRLARYASDPSKAKTLSDFLVKRKELRIGSKLMKSSDFH